jgi:predicted membrane channel-forming protein YqfA (hemolysin III family)
MKKENLMPRAVYAVSFAVILIIEILIAFFVRDSFIRPYGGDILVTILICCFMRMIFMEKIPLLPLWVFLFAVTVEVLQYFDIVSILGLDDIKFFVILIGNSFSFVDIICYAVGCVLFYLREKLNIKVFNRQ